MEEIENFIHQYIDEEHNFYVQFLTTKDISKNKNDYELFKNKYFTFNIRNYYMSTTPTVPYEKWYSDGIEIAKNSEPRSLFKIKKYKHNDLGIIYRCYTTTCSPSKRMPKNYRENLFILSAENGFQIFSIYIITPKLKLVSNNLKTWVYQQGKEIQESHKKNI